MGGGATNKMMFDAITPSFLLNAPTLISFQCRAKAALTPTPVQFNIVTTHVNSTPLKDLLKKALAAGLKKPSTGSVILVPQIERTLAEFISTDQSVEDEILQFIKSEPELSEFNGKMFNAGSGFWHGLYPEALLRWLLNSSHSKGIEVSVDSLERFLKMDFTPATEVLAIAGVTVENPVAIKNDVTLLPFASLPSSNGKDAFDPPYLKREALKRLGLVGVSLPRGHNPPTAALRRSVKLFPKCVENSTKAPRPIENELFRVCEALTLVGDCAPVAVAFWHAVDDWVPCSSVLSSGWGSPVYDVARTESHKLSVEECSQAVSICHQFFALDQKVKGQLRVPIQRLNQARRRRSAPDKAIDLGIAFEALYLNDRSHKEQISFTFRLRGAWFLGKDKEERTQLMSDFSKIYECRSTAVHTGKLNDKITIPGRGEIASRDFLKQADALCARSIWKIVESGCFPNWNEIVLGV